MQEVYAACSLPSDRSRSYASNDPKFDVKNATN